MPSVSWGVVRSDGPLALRSGREKELAPMAEKRRQMVRVAHHSGVLYDSVKGATYLIDLRGGEFAQRLAPWVAVPIAGDETAARASIRLARGFNVPYLDLRTSREVIPAWSIFLAERGIANCWA